VLIPSRSPFQRPLSSSSGKCNQPLKFGAGSPVFPNYHFLMMETENASNTMEFYSEMTQLMPERFLSPLVALKISRLTERFAAIHQ
jgi:hypothetical protein